MGIGFHWWIESDLHILFTVGVMDAGGGIRNFTLNRVSRE